ncbi:hypothetical protein NXC14_CH00962 [Rhizobium sp. NXC14]|nr:hypothetical protein NXC14_CH00962 [Rhizobium sp. NXC14]
MFHSRWGIARRFQQVLPRRLPTLGDANRCSQYLLRSHRHTRGAPSRTCKPGSNALNQICFDPMNYAVMSVWGNVVRQYC